MGFNRVLVLVGFNGIVSFDSMMGTSDISTDRMGFDEI
jgi:hypothetical protein